MKRFFQLFIPALILILLGGCIHFKIYSRIRPHEEDVRWAQLQNKVFVIHDADNKAFDLIIDDISKDTIKGRVKSLSGRHSILIEKPEGGHYKEEDKYILKEAHLYTDNPAIKVNEGKIIEIPVTDISKLDTYEKDKAKDAWSIIGSVALTAGVIGGGALIYAALTSCPYVYVESPSGSFELAGEIFGGAVYVPLERHDYMALPDAHEGAVQYTIRISNELSEVQYINMALLTAVTHSPEATILPDRTGRLFSVREPILPAAVISEGGTDLTGPLCKADGETFRFDEPPEITGDSSAFNTVYLTFPVPEDSDTGKLLIRAGNLVWGDYQITEYNKLFGNKYDNWIRRQRKGDGLESIKWMHNQKLFMDVSVRTDTGWRYVDYFELTGPEGRRDLIMPIALQDVRKVGKELNTVELKLTTGFMFWEIDYAGMDFTDDVTMNIQQLQPLSAVTESGAEMAARLSEDDSHYYIQYEPGECCTITYLIPGTESSMATSLILHSKGYYEHVRDYKEPPDIPAILSFNRPGKLSRFSSDNYKEFIENKAVLVKQTPK